MFDGDLTASMKLNVLREFSLTRAMSRAFDYSSLLLRVNKRANFLIKGIDFVFPKYVEWVCVMSLPLWQVTTFPVF